MMGVLVAASSSSRPEIIPAYYDRAVAYDHELDEAERSRHLGWHATATLATDGLVVEVTDRAGAPITDAKVSIVGFQRAYASEALDLALVATGGNYRARRALRAGVYDLQIRVDRAGVEFVARQTVELK
jgi:nitrogen fixation protein FixH